MRTRIRALRRRLQRLCAVEARGRARDGAAAAALCRPAAPDQRVEKCDRLGDEPQAAGLLLLGSTRANGEASGSEESPGGHERAGPLHHETERRTEHRTDRGEAAQLPNGM